jgi:hypothetical protein
LNNLKLWLLKLGAHPSAITITYIDTRTTGISSIHLVDESLMSYPKNKSVNFRMGR